MGETNRKETTEMLSRLIAKHFHFRNTRVYWAKEVTFDYATDHPVRVDFMIYKPVNGTVSGIERGTFYCFEVKSSVEDFHSKNGHNLIGDLNYYVMPHDVYEAVQKEIPWWAGVYCPADWGGEIEPVRKATRRDRSRPVAEMLLMMFRSAARDREQEDFGEGEDDADE